MKWANNERVVGYWQWTTDPQITELMSRTGVDVGLLDCQHGMLGRSEMYKILPAMKTAKCVPGVRIPSLDEHFIGAALDQGAELLVCPLVNSKEECERFVKSAYFPPHGIRSFGPGRALLDTDTKSWFDTQQPGHPGRPLLFAMIETEEGLKNVEEVCEVELLDGILIGPYDLSCTCLEPMNPAGERTTAAIKRIAAACLKHGKKLSIYSANSSGASVYANANGKFGKDFDLLFAFHDTALLTAAATREVKQLKAQPYAGETMHEGKGDYYAPRGIKTE